MLDFPFSHKFLQCIRGLELNFLGRACSKHACEESGVFLRLSGRGERDKREAKTMRKRKTNKDAQKPWGRTKRYWSHVSKQYYFGFFYL